LQVAFGHGNGLRNFRGLVAHKDGNDDGRRSNPAAYLPFPSHSGAAYRQRRTEGQRLLHRRRPLRGATAERAVHPIDMRRTRMTTNLAKPLLHRRPRHLLSQVSCRKIVARVGREGTKLCNRWNAARVGAQPGRHLHSAAGFRGQWCLSGM
jgi:hypothetical protein